MAADAVLFRDLAYVFVAAVLGGVLARLARQPLILGYVVGGLAISPFTPGPSVSDVHTFELFAEIGVILLMYSVGIEFSIRELLQVKGVALIGAPLGILLSIGLGLGAGALAGWPPVQGAVVGMVISVASTMVLARLLMERGELRSRHGRIMIGITLVEDLAVVVLIVLIPALGAVEAGRLLALAVAFGKAALILVPFAFLAARVLPGLLTHVARTQSPEILLLVALAIGFGTAALTQAVGLSLALGAFLAGLLVSASDYAHEMLARLLSLRDVFVALFFVTIGALLNPATVFANLPLLALFLALIVVGKFVTRTLVVWLLRYPLATAMLVGVGLTQIGEFSFILVQVAYTSGIVGADVYNATLAASLLSILINAALVRYVPAWIGAARLARAARPGAQDEIPVDSRRGHVVLCGFGRVGSAVGEALETFGVGYTVIERDPDICRDLRARGVPCIFGDAGHAALLARAGADRATLIVLTLPEIEAARLTVRAIRRMAPAVPLLARAHGRLEAERLVTDGATEVIQPEVEASATLIRHALNVLNLSKERTLAYLERFRDAMEAARVDEESAPQGLPKLREVMLKSGTLADLTLRDAQVRERYGVTVVAISRRDGVILNPRPETMLRAGDRVRVFGLGAQIEAFATAAGDAGQT